MQRFQLAYGPSRVREQAGVKRLGSGLASPLWGRVVLAALALLAEAPLVAGLQEPEEPVPAEELLEEAVPPEEEIFAPGRLRFRDVTFDRLPEGWQRQDLLSEAGRAPWARFVSREELRDLNLGVNVIPLTRAGRVLTPTEVAAAIRRGDVAALERGWGANLTRRVETERVVAGRAYPVLEWRASAAAGIVLDGLFVYYVPSDYAGRGRSYAVLWFDYHSPTVGPRGLDELEALVASLEPVALGTVLARDDFDDADAGLLAKSSTRPRWHFGYEDGEYAIRKLEPVAGAGVGDQLAPGNYADISVAADVRVADGADVARVFVNCRSANRSEYRLRFDPGPGRFLLVRVDSGQIVTLVGPEAPPVINPGGEPNRLELTCSGTTISGSINGVEVARVEDNSYAWGRAGIGAFAQPAEGVFEARFDNLVITQQ